MLGISSETVISQLISIHDGSLDGMIVSSRTAGNLFRSIVNSDESYSTFFNDVVLKLFNYDSALVNTEIKNKSFFTSIFTKKVREDDLISPFVRMSWKDLLSACHNGLLPQTRGIQMIAQMIDIQQDFFSDAFYFWNLETIHCLTNPSFFVSGDRFSLFVCGIKFDFMFINYFPILTKESFSKAISSFPLTGYFFKMAKKAYVRSIHIHGSDPRFSSICLEAYKTILILSNFGVQSFPSGIVKLHESLLLENPRNDIQSISLYYSNRDFETFKSRLARIDGFDKFVDKFYRKD